ncbi:MULTISPECIES: shikimate dehydrogenase [unclassified Bradyrhizobium]|uniref:shikimate dehydrogenase n=1 Tax=unclassified Bradyrhizobium TaxID=2631580 RepID=UPI0024494174|nr:MULTISPECIES: shikimate dehydrogenase [unclassified Bradyrhizobium]MDH2341455.1 shikimate dehydrogenase [Bradyrhizobium sp. SSUT77]MDH2354857.1 shikimate dehydrogenase [Bradyrhizobium sp. SSUT112]
MHPKPSFLVGLIGSGIAASRTPSMHEAAAAAAGIRYLYKKIDLTELKLGVEALPELLTAARRMGFDGLNVTHPCKQAIPPLLDELSPDAETLGAVNTVVIRNGRMTGHNTDWFGFAENFRRNMQGASLGRVVQFGAGGAGAAVAFALMRLGVQELTIVDVDLAKARSVVDVLSPRFLDRRLRAGQDVAAAVAAADGIVNATPIGMDKHPGTPLPMALLRHDLWVAEIVYFPLETALLRAARTLGCRTVDGGGMAIFQGTEAFRLFTGVSPDPDVFFATFASLGG